MPQWCEPQALAERLDATSEAKPARLGFGTPLGRESIDSDTVG